MGFYKEKYLGDGIYDFSDVLGVHMHLISGDDKALLVDTGYGFPGLKKLVKSAEPKKEIKLFNTHWHPDHSAANHKFSQCMIGEEDFPLKTPGVYENLVTDISGRIVDAYPKMKIPAKVIVKVLTITQGKTKYIPVKDGEKIDLGNRVLEFKNLPGHTPGSMVILDKETETIFTGDAVNMATWLFTNPNVKFSEYSKTLKSFAEENKKSGYKWLVCSHVPGKYKYSYINDYAKFISNIKPDGKKIQIGKTVLKSPLCISAKISLKHKFMAVFYFADQNDN